MCTRDSFFVFLITLQHMRAFSPVSLWCVDMQSVCHLEKADSASCWRKMTAMNSIKNPGLIFLRLKTFIRFKNSIKTTAHICLVWMQLYFKLLVLIGRVTPQSKSVSISPVWILQCCSHRQGFRLVNEIYGLCSSDCNNNCLHTRADPVALLFVGWQAPAAPPTHTWRNSRSSLKWGEGSFFFLFFTSLPSPSPLSLITGNRFVWIHPLNWIPGLQGVTSGKTCLNHEGRMMCILGAMGKQPL